MTEMTSSAVLTIAQELAEVGRLIDGDDIPAVVGRYVRRAVATLPGCDYAVIVAAGAPGTLEVVADAGEIRPARPAEVAALPGPITEAIRYGEPRRLGDVATDDRWPLYSAFLRRCGYQGCLALPLAARQEPTAAFILFATQPDQFGSDSNDLALLFTLHAGVAFDNARMYHDSHQLVDHLHAALRTRTVIAQSQGLLMRHYGWDAGTAFAAMARSSQNHNTKLRMLATSLVDAHHAGTWDTALLDYHFAGDDQGETKPPAFA